MKPTARSIAMLALVGAGFCGACSDDRHQVGISAPAIGTLPDGGAVDGGAADASADSPPLTISPDEVAKRLARLIWNDTPDAALLATVNAGMARTRADVGNLARQMLTDARARVGVGAFYRWWLTLDFIALVTKDTTLYPEWTPDLGADAARETELFAVAATLDGDGRFQTLMTGSFSYVNERLAGLYGLSNVTGTELRRVNLDPAQRAGLLTQLSLLAMGSQSTHTSPSGRGHLVRARFYCTAIAIPAMGAHDPTGHRVLPPNPTGRQVLEAQLAVSDDTCQACHAQVDPIGYAFEGFDPIGRVRTTDNSSPVDTTGRIANAAGLDIPFNGAVDLAAILTGLDDVQACIARRWLGYGLRRNLMPSEDGAVADLHAAFQRAGLDLRALIVAVAQSDLFLAP